MEDNTLVNRVAGSGLITINLEDFFPKQSYQIFDIKEYLFHGLILKEKEFRESLKNLDWSNYQDKIVLINCSTDAVIPLWAYMLISVYLKDIAFDIYQGSWEDYLLLHYRNEIQKIDTTQFMDKRIVIKGCGNKPVPSYAYTLITSQLMPVAQSIMFGEPCSTVPIYKRPRQISSN